jgi:hypothetical protein
VYDLPVERCSFHDVHDYRTSLFWSLVIWASGDKKSTQSLISAVDRGKWSVSRFIAGTDPPILLE